MSYIVRLLTTTFSSLLISAVYATAFLAPPNNLPIVLDAKEPIREFIKANGAAERAALKQGSNSNTMLSIPVVYVYSPEGDRIFTGGGQSAEEAARTLSVLEGLPASVEHLTPIAGTPKLSAMLAIVAQYKAAQGQIIGDGHYVVYIIMPNLDRPTKIETAMAQLRARGKNLPLDTLLLRLDQ